MDVLLWGVTGLNAAIFINTVMFPRSSQRQTVSGSLALDQTNHLSSYFCTWPLLSNTPSHSSPCPTQHLRLARLLPSQLSDSPSALIKGIDLPKSCLHQQPEPAGAKMGERASAANIKDSHPVHSDVH